MSGTLQIMITNCWKNSLRVKGYELCHFTGMRVQTENTSKVSVGRSESLEQTNIGWIFFHEDMSRYKNPLFATTNIPGIHFF